MALRDALCGRTVGEFVLRERIGEGGFGAVYRCEQPLLGRQAVIKVLHGRLRTNEVVIQRFLREARLASRLDHPYAAHVYAFGVEKEDGLLWIAMEMVHGTPLDKWLRTRGPLPIDQLVPFVERLAEVVHTAHEQGIVHRDLKPSNVMVIERAGRLLPKLLDLGIARATQEHASPVKIVGEDDTVPPLALADDADTIAPVDNRSAQGSGEVDGLTAAGSMMGSPPYMAPEQWKSEPVTAAADVYALGIVCFEALTGRRPFVADTLHEYGVLHASKPVPTVGAELAPGLDPFFRRALAKRPSDRPATALELAAGLRVAAGLLDAPAELPKLDHGVHDAWLADAPQPLAEAVAIADGARNPHQAREALWDLVLGVLRYLTAIALAARAQVRVDNEDRALADRLRALDQRELDLVERVALLRALTRAFTEQPGAYPIPDLVAMLAPSERVESLDRLIDLRESSEQGTSDDLVRSHLTRLVPEVSRFLRGAAFILDYPLVVPRGTANERWTGLPRPRRPLAVVRGHQPVDREPFLTDRDGQAIVLLTPVVQIVAPVAGAEDEIFVIDGRGRHGMRLVAAGGYEHHSSALREWLGEQIGGATDRVDATDERPPYLGLSSFASTDADRFVGRERETDVAVNRLRQQPLLLVVGASGAGKSSFVHAGVVPALLPSWKVTSMRPGARPLTVLTSRLAALGVAQPDLTAGAPDSVIAQVANTIIVVDQLEELFTLCLDDHERTRFAEIIAHLSSSADVPTRVIATIRDDFLMRLEALGPMRSRVSPALMLLGNPSRDDLARTIVEPARRAGYALSDPDLAHAMVDAVADRPGALALVSFTAERLWELRDRRFKQLTRKAYDAMGGVGGALARHAEQTLSQMIYDERRVVRELFRHLVTAEGTRAHLTRGEIAQLVTDVATDPVIEKLVQARLLTSVEGDDGSDWIEITHEALLTEWTTLQSWLAEDQEARAARARVVAAAAEWERLDRKRESLWNRAQLASAQAAARLSLGVRENAFLSASRRHARRTRVALTLLVLGVPLALAAAYGGSRYKAHVELRRHVDALSREASAQIDSARHENANVDKLRSEAFALFDSGRRDAAEAVWNRVRAASELVDRHFASAGEVLDRALAVDLEREDTRVAIGELLYERAILAERDGKTDQLIEVLRRMRALGQGQLERRWSAPAQLRIRTAPPGAKVTISRYASDERGGRPLVDTRDLRSTPLDELTLAPGSYRLSFSMPDRAEVRYPILVGRGQAIDIALDMPEASAIPDGFVYVPAGSFLFGAGGDETLRNSFFRVAPLHSVATKAFLIARYETTYAEWLSWVSTLAPSERSKRLPFADASFGKVSVTELAGGAWELAMTPASKQYKARSGEAIVYASRTKRASQDWLRFPVGGISWDDANAYVAWLDRTGRVHGARLCTELEWERAARGADDRQFPHGDVLEPDDANHNRTYGENVLDALGPDEVGSHPASESPFGVADLVGNSWEWTVSSLTDSPSALRGGSYYFPSLTNSIINREEQALAMRALMIGLRVCADYPHT